jgi:hypothetical protein
VSNILFEQLPPELLYPQDSLVSRTGPVENIFFVDKTFKIVEVSSLFTSAIYYSYSMRPTLN